MLRERWQTYATEASGTYGPGAALIETLQPLSFQGADVVNFLQGYLTIDLEGLVEAEPRMTALTNLKGRVVATGWCQRHGNERIDWLIHAELAEAVSTFMARYLAFSKTELVELAPDHLTLGVIDAAGNASARLITSDEALEEITRSHQPIDPGLWYGACIDQGLVLIGPATTETYLPQMIGLVEAGAVDFDKGCYLGQEVVARAQHRGEVKRRLQRLVGVGEAIAPGTPALDADGREVGQIVLCEAPQCLAVIRQPAASTYQVGDQQLEAAG